MRSQMATLVDQFELAFPVPELPLPAIERYRLVPMTSLYLEVDFEDTDDGDSFGDDRESSSRGASSFPGLDAAPQSDRYLRARCWVSEE
jgi:hypothetical protein